MKKILIFLSFLIFGFSIFGQQRDYSEIRFKSKLRQYTKTLPKAKELGLNKELFTQLVHCLTLDKYTESEKIDLTNKLWLAISDPKKFDFIYKDFSLNTIKNWGVKIKFEDPIFEPNPYLAKWTTTVDDFTYFQWATNQILTSTGLLTYSEKAKVAQKSVHDLILLEGLKFFNAIPNEYAYDYLDRNNQLLKRKGLVFLIYNNNFDYTVCKINDKEKVIELLAKLQWDFVVP